MDTLQLGYDVRAYGALGDGINDDTAAIQAAIDAAGNVQGGVCFPPGVYATGKLRLHSNVALIGTPTWGYRAKGGTVLRLNDASAPCLLDLTGTNFVRINGLSLDGADLGTETVGIQANGEGHDREESLVIEHTRVAHFSGTGIRLDYIWGFTVRHSMVIFNKGHGLHFTRWDGWVLDTVFNNNAGWAIYGERPCASVTFVGNRIEWCYKGGVCLEGGHHHLNDNMFDRNGGPGLFLSGADATRENTFSVTGNLFHRNGAKSEPGSHDSCHARFECIDGLVFQGNTMSTGVNDSGTGLRSPSYGIICSRLRHSIVKDNVLHRGALLAVVEDLGGHDGASIIRDNIGCLWDDME